MESVRRPTNGFGDRCTSSRSTRPSRRSGPSLPRLATIKLSDGQIAHAGARLPHTPRATPRVLTPCSRVAPAARASEARPCCPSPPPVRSSSLARPLLASSHILCALARALSSCGSARLGLWLAVLLPRSELEIHLCQGRTRAAPARAGVRGALALRRGVLPRVWWPSGPSLGPSQGCHSPPALSQRLSPGACGSWVARCERHSACRGQVARP